MVMAVIRLVLLKLPFIVKEQLEIRQIVLPAPITALTALLKLIVLYAKYSTSSTQVGAWLTALK